MFSKIGKENERQQESFKVGKFFFFNCNKSRHRTTRLKEVILTQLLRETMVNLGEKKCHLSQNNKYNLLICLLDLDFVFWLQPDSALSITALWGVNPHLKDSLPLSLSVSLSSLFFFLIMPFR